MSNGNDNPAAHSVRQADHDRDDAREESVLLDRRVMDGDLRYHIMLEIDNIKERLTKFEGKHESLEGKVDLVITILQGGKIAIYILISLASFVAAMAAAFAWIHDKLSFK